MITLRKARAFTSIDLLVIVTLAFILIALLIPAFGKAKAKSERIRCANHLKTAGLAWRTIALNHTNQMKWQGMRDYDAFFKETVLSLSNLVADPKIFACPADSRPAHTNWIGFSRTNFSYFYNADADDSLPQSFMAGDRNLTTNDLPVGPGFVRIAPGTTVGWTKKMHKRQGNVVMGDGSVQQLNGVRFQERAPNSRTLDTVLALP